MSVYNIQWSVTRLPQLPEERYAHFYALVFDGELVFMGRCFREELVELIPACIAQLGLDHLGLQVFLGRIREIGTGRISDTTVDALLGMLVFARKPRLNRAGKYRYQGVLDMRLANVGCEWLPSHMRSEGNCVIVGPQPARTLVHPVLAC